MTDASDGGKDSAWGKLRRRKLVQWGIAYAAGAWGLLQGLQFLAEAFDWSSRVLQFGTLIALIGLPIVLVLAWFHGDRGHQRPIRSELAILALLLLVGGAGLWVYQRSIGSTAESTAKSAPAPATVPSERKASASVAVLPFSNLSSDPANAYLADGIAETLITMLTQVPQLMVIGKVSSFSYKGQAVDPRTIGQQLGVGALLEGSVQRAGDRLRVAVQLVSTGDGGHLWAETYDRPATDVFAVQDEIAKRVTEALSVALSGKSGPGSIGTTNVAAYDSYLRGKQLVESRETRAMQEGIALLEKAVSADPNFARGWVELSSAYLTAVRSTAGNPYGFMPAEQAMPLSKRAAIRAVEVAPEFGLAQAQLGRALAALEIEGFAEHYERAMALSPGDPEVIKLYAGRYLLRTNRSREGLKLLEPLLAVEPRDPRLRSTYGLLLDASGDVSGALRQYREAIRLRPESVEPYLTAAVTTFHIVGDSDLSLRLLRRAASLDAENAAVYRILALLYWRLDEKQLALKAEQELQRLGATDHLRMSRAYAATLAGRPEEARALLQQLLRESPQDDGAIWDLSRLPGTPENHREVLVLATKWTAANAQWSASEADARICLNAWLGDEAAAEDELTRSEPVWRSRHAFGYLSSWARTDRLVRSLACVGRTDDALTELEALLKEGYDIGWRNMAVDPAYDGIRGDPRFKAVSDKLKAADAAARDRFRARPDLNDADIESLGM